MLNIKFFDQGGITLYLLYLKIKAYLVIRQSKIKLIGCLFALLIIVCVAMMFAFKVNIFTNKDAMIYTLIAFAWSTLAFVIFGLMANFKLKDLQKKILCNHLSTGYKECDNLIKMIMEKSRIDGCCRFEYENQLLIIGMYDGIDEPFIAFDDMNKTFPDEEVRKYMIYPNEYAGTYPFLKEFLVKIVRKREDYVRLEKIAFQMWG